MNSFKKILVYVFVVLFLVSIHRDLTIGTPLDSKSDGQHDNPMVEEEQANAVKISVNKGDTVLSIVEELNEQNDRELDIPQIMTDFKALNPGVEPLHIESGDDYYFPLYK
ncbi:hypothetical protein [Lentibacillus sp.]|uniref:hypothetical protein n=1 Tax=Lentibacillus sp. TaxID=1925746 RepID=UPI002B4AB7A7|nr:hypothetical protein [Lentibacillus sp.]HLS07964.1 hypothetical protein [Lentibacillus sp.]